MARNATNSKVIAMGKQHNVSRGLTIHNKCYITK